MSTPLRKPSQIMMVRSIDLDFESSRFKTLKFLLEILSETTAHRLISSKVSVSDMPAVGTAGKKLSFPVNFLHLSAHYGAPQEPRDPFVIFLDYFQGRLVHRPSHLRMYCPCLCKFCYESSEHQASE